MLLEWEFGVLRRNKDKGCRMICTNCVELQDFIVNLKKENEEYKNELLYL